MDIRRYLYRTDNANEYAISLSSKPQNLDWSRWTVSSVDNTTFRFVHIFVWHTLTNNCDENIGYRVPVQMATICCSLIAIQER